MENLVENHRNVCAKVSEKRRENFPRNRAVCSSRIISHIVTVLSKPQMNLMRSFLHWGTQLDCLMHATCNIALITFNGLSLQFQDASVSFDWKIYCDLFVMFMSSGESATEPKVVYFFRHRTLKHVMCSNYRLGLININGLTTNWSLLFHSESFFRRSRSLAQRISFLLSIRSSLYGCHHRMMLGITFGKAVSTSGWAI